MSEISSPNSPNAATAKTTGSAPRRHDNSKRGSSGDMRTLFALLIAAGIGGGGYFLWHSLQDIRQQLATSTTSTRQQLDTLAARADQLEQHVNHALPEKIQTLQAQQQSLEEAVGKLRSEAGGDSHVWDAEEIAALLQIANDRLYLEKEIAAGRAALEAADRHLRTLRNPSLLDVRRLLAEEIAALRSIADPDITGMALALGTLIDGIDRLPIANASLMEQNAPVTSAETGWHGVLHDLWKTLKSLVIIKHHGETDRPLLAPNERYFLRQNLRLNLESARIALLRHDGKPYQQALRSAQEWITLYFDNDATATTATLEELARLQRVDIAPSLPDISGSLNALQTWLTQRGQQKPHSTPGVTPP